MNFATYYYLEEDLKTKLKALGLAGLAALSNPAKAQDMSVSFNLPGQTEVAKRPTTPKRSDERVSEIDIVAATIFKEARGEGLKGMQAVNEVINNRAKAQNKTRTAICLQPKQFSCWNGITPSKIVIDKLQRLDPQNFAIAKKIAQNQPTNHTRGSQFYHTVNISPKWGKNLKRNGYKTLKIGDHVFYYKS